VLVRSSIVKQLSDRVMKVWKAALQYVEKLCAIQSQKQVMCVSGGG
jgi:hypothetical protein